MNRDREKITRKTNSSAEVVKKNEKHSDFCDLHETQSFLLKSQDLDDTLLPIRFETVTRVTNYFPEENFRAVPYVRSKKFNLSLVQGN